jgi:predicted thioredoxin/glutaredoxin
MNNKDVDLRFLSLQKVKDEKDTFERIAQGTIKKRGYDEWMVEELLHQVVVSAFLIACLLVWNKSLRSFGSGSEVFVFLRLTVGNLGNGAWAP